MLADAQMALLAQVTVPSSLVETFDGDAYTYSYSAAVFVLFGVLGILCLAGGVFGLVKIGIGETRWLVTFGSLVLVGLACMISLTMINGDTARVQADRIIVHTANGSREMRYDQLRRIEWAVTKDTSGNETKRVVFQMQDGNAHKYQGDLLHTASKRADEYIKKRQAAGKAPAPRSAGQPGAPAPAPPTPARPGGP